MQNGSYSRKRMLEILKLSDDSLRTHESNGVLSSLGGPREEYGSELLSAYRSALGLHPPQQPARRQLFLNFKGGTGKTSLSVSYAHRLAEVGHRVLLVDLDSQGHASKCLGYDAEEVEKTLYDVIIKGTPVEEAVLVTPLTELKIIPSNLRMSTVDLALMPMTNRERRLRKALDAAASNYDFIIMDAPPSFGLLNLNAIIACQDLFVPVLPDFLSFHGLKLLFETLDDLEEDMDHHLDRIFIVINQFNPTTTMARAARSALEQHYPEHLLPIVVRQCTKFAQASGDGVPIFLRDPASKAAEDIEALVLHTSLANRSERGQDLGEAIPAPASAAPASTASSSTNSSADKVHRSESPSRSDNPSSRPKKVAISAQPGDGNGAPIAPRREGRKEPAVEAIRAAEEPIR